MDKELFNKIVDDKRLIDFRLNSVRKIIKIKTEKYNDMIYNLGWYCVNFLTKDTFDEKKVYRWICDINDLAKVIDINDRQFNDLLFASKRLERYLEDIRNG